MRDLNRLELVGETVRLALNALAVAAPEWLRECADPEWAARYARPLDEGRLPSGKEKRRAEAERIGGEGFVLLDAVGDEAAPWWLRELPAVETLRRVWLQNYLRTSGGAVRWRRLEEDGLPPASDRIDSPTDPESRRARKSNTAGVAAVRWLGYKVHLTETCDDDMPRIVTHVETHAGPTPDRRAIPAVHEALETRDLLPSVHLVDMGYTDVGALLEARDRHRVDLLGTMRQNYGWHAREGTGFGLESFEIDWEKREATCPEGKRSIHWRDRKRRGEPIFGIAFSPKDCGVCPSRDLCVRLKRRLGQGNPYRELTVPTKERHEALRIAREREETEGYSRGVCRTAGDRGHRIVGRAGLRFEARPLPGTREGASGPRARRHGAEPLARRRVDLGKAASPYPRLAVRLANGAPGGVSATVAGAAVKMR